VHRHSTSQQLALRARMILHTADNIGVRESARELDVWPKTVRYCRGRWRQGPAAQSVSEGMAGGRGAGKSLSSLAAEDSHDGAGGPPAGAVGDAPIRPGLREPMGREAGPRFAAGFIVVERANVRGLRKAGILS
jgi:hypothetical protein